MNPNYESNRARVHPDIPDGHIEEAAESMRKAGEETYGAQKLKGLRAYFAGVDRALVAADQLQCYGFGSDAEQMSSFQPMLDLRPAIRRSGATSCDPCQTSTAYGSGVTSPGTEH